MFFSWRSLLILLLAAILLGQAALAADHIPGPVAATVERVVDGDTVRVRAQIWLGQEVSVSVRVGGIDAPELFRPKCTAEKARAYAAKDFVIDFLGEEAVQLFNIEPDKYGGRVVADLVNADGENLATALVGADHAFSGKRGRWCS